MKRNLLIIVSILLISCGTSKHVSVANFSTPLSKNETVEVYGQGQQVPAGAKYLGVVKIGDSGITTKCSYSDVITDAQNQARSMGGNILIITKHKEPSLWSTCHRIKADVYVKK